MECSTASSSHAPGWGIKNPARREIFSGGLEKRGRGLGVREKHKDMRFMGWILMRTGSSWG